MPITKRRKTKLSEGVIRQQRPAVDIQKSAVGNAEPVADDLRGFLTRGLPEGQTLPDMALLQVILGNIVVHDSQAMEDADEANFDAFSRLNRLQLKRDAYKDDLIPTLIEIRDTFNTAFGTDSCQRVLGLGVEMPVETLRVRRLGDRVVRLLSADDFELPPAKSDIAGVDLEKWVKMLKPNLNSLHETMDQISEAKREYERTLAAKNLAVETYQETYLRGAQLLEALYKVSGNEHLAAKLRPATPKPRSTAKDDDGQGSEPASGDGAEPTTTGDTAEPGVGADGPLAEVFVPERPSLPELLQRSPGYPLVDVRPDRPPTEARPDRPPVEVRPDRPPAETEPATS